MVQLKSRQRGLSFLGLLFVGGLLAVAGVIAAKIVPTAIEYQAVIKAANKASEGNTVAEVRNIFQMATEVYNISSISAKEIDVTKEGDKIVVGFDYQREINLAGPGYLTLKYTGRSR